MEKPPTPHLQLHSRFCSVAAAISLFWTLSLLHFHTNYRLFPVAQPPYSINLLPSSSQPTVIDNNLRFTHSKQHVFSTSPADESDYDVALKSSSSSSSLLSSSLLQSSSSSSSSPSPPADPCYGKYVYIHSLPPMFNDVFLSNCLHYTNTWFNICTIASNGGLGPILQDNDGVLTPPHNGGHSWYNTDQFILDVIFHSRMKKYNCLTSNSSKAALIYVPFYAGLDITRHLWGFNISIRDYLPHALADWLPRQPQWRSMGGKDHFFVTGKISWDFRRPKDNDSHWGNKLLNLHALQNVSVLLIEKGPEKASHVEHAVPYPTYFHPYRDSEVIDWQSRMRAFKRVNLFAFAGASRPEFGEYSIRGELIEQCKNSSFCKLLECNRWKSGCNSPTTVMKLFQESIFCLQPPGDSYTRRSVFDSMVSGCIPVLFNPYTAYTQYTWHLPQNFSSYSVFIPERDIKRNIAVIEQILLKIPPAQVQKMREKVISLLPNLIYAHPDHKLEKVKDAFDVAMEALIKKVTDTKRRTER